MKKRKSDRQGESWLGLERGEFMSRWYRNEYTDNAYGNASSLIQTWMHRSIERHYTTGDHFPRVLEIGGNVGEHIPFVRHSFDDYYLTDLHAKPNHEQLNDFAKRRIHFETANVQSLEYDSAYFDRVVATCLLHHVPDPESALEEMRRVTRPGGRIDIFLSADPGAMFRLARAIGPLRRARRTGLGNVKTLVDARDHINHVGGLTRLIRHVFRLDDVKERSYPLPYTGWNGMLWKNFRINRHL